MAVRLRVRLECAISSDSSEERDLGNGVFSLVSDALGEGGSWKTKVPAGSVDMAIPFVNVASIKAFLLVISAVDPTDDPVSLFFKLNSALATAIEVAPILPSNNKEAYFLLHTNGLTDLFVSNPGAIDMNVRIFAGGD